MQFFLLQASESKGFFADPMNMVLISGLMFAIYFFMLRPNKKKADQAKEVLENLGKGDKIVTTGGIHGKVMRVNETTVDIDIAKNTIMTIEKSSISVEATAALNKPEEEKK